MGIGNRIKSSIQKLANTSKETLSPQQQFSNFASGRFELKTSEFISDIFDDSRNTPHKEMRQGWRMLQNDIQIAQSVSKKNLLIWGREITVETEDDNTKEEFDNDIIPNFKSEAITAGKHAVALGNGYIEVIRGEQTGAPVDFEAVNRPHKVYPMYEKDSLEITAYVIESFKATDADAEKHKVMTSERTTRSIRGRKIPAENIIHLRTGSSAMPGLGRSDFLSAVDDYKISRELKNFQGVAARHKMNPRKAFVFNEDNGSSGIDEPGSTASSEAQKERQQELNNLDHDENPVFHDVELDILDYDYDPQMPQAQDVLEKLSRDMTSPLPQFLSHASDSNRATSRESKNVLQMELTAQRHVWSSAINPVFQEIAAARGLDTDVTVKFGEFSFPTRDERTQEIMDMFQNNMLTLGQAVQRMPYEVEVPDELQDQYNFELDTGENPFDQLGQKLDDIGEVDEEKLSEAIPDGQTD
jgi:hypothetical protein